MTYLSTPLTITPPPDLTELVRAFDNDGFLCLSSLFPPESTNDLRAAADSNFTKCFHILHSAGNADFPESHRQVEESAIGGGARYEYPIDSGVVGGFKEVVMRSPGRYEMSYCCDQDPFNRDFIRLQPDLLALISSLLADRGGAGGMGESESDTGMYLCNASIVISTPGSVDQGWHADGGHVDLQRHLPCHCLNIFIPLVDITEEMGPTELRPGECDERKEVLPTRTQRQERPHV